MYLYLNIDLDRILHTKREASTANRLFNMSCMAQTKCRNKLSPQIAQTIRELGLDFVITGQASSIRQRRQDKQTKGNNPMQVTQSTVNITLYSFRTFRSNLMTSMFMRRISTSTSLFSSNFLSLIWSFQTCPLFLQFFFVWDLIIYSIQCCKHSIQLDTFFFETHACVNVSASRLGKLPWSSEAMTPSWCTSKSLVNG